LDNDGLDTFVVDCFGHPDMFPSINTKLDVCTYRIQLTQLV